MELGTEDLRSPAALKAALAELLATALFIFLGVGSIAAFILTAPDVGGGIVIIAASFGFAIALLAAGAGPISGGHINPAVTFAMLITGQITVTRAGMYIVAQLVGAAIGALLLRLFLTDEVLAQIPGAGGNAISDIAVTSNLAAVGIEATMTFLLVWTIFATAVSPRGSGNLAPLFIGFAVFVLHLVTIPLTGSGVNPARTFGPALMLPEVAEGLPGRWEDWWVYYVGPLIGAAVAAIGFWVLYMQNDDSNA
jgi:MIP family channel proteins